MEGLEYLTTVPPRVAREEFQILTDEPVYQLVLKYASRADIEEIQGWARSFYTIEGHLESISNYRKPLLPEPTVHEWAQAKEQTMATVINSIDRVASLTFEDGFDSVPYEHSSAAGYSYVGKKGEGDNFKKAKRIANALVRTFAEDVEEHGLDEAARRVIANSTPDVGFTRTQLAKLPSIKVRNVFGEAFHYILIEGLSASPLLEAFKVAETFYVTGKDPTSYVPQILTRMDRQDPDNGWFIALDWSKFDATVQLWEIDHAFDCIEQLLIFPTPLTKAAFDISRILFKERKLAGPDGSLWLRHGGIPSGSYFTNLIGSIINYTRVQFICITAGYHVHAAYVQGDDSVIRVTAQERPDVIVLANTVAAFGWILNPTKCIVSKYSEEITFLGRSQRALFNTRERLKVLRLMCFPEYKVDSPTISTARMKAIAQDAGFNDPMYNRIYYALRALYGEATYVPPHLRPYVSVVDWNDVNM